LKFFSSLCVTIEHRPGQKYFPFPPSTPGRTQTVLIFPSLWTERHQNIFPFPPSPPSTESLCCRHCHLLSLLLAPPPLSALPAPTHLPAGATPYLCYRCPPSLCSAGGATSCWRCLLSLLVPPTSLPTSTASSARRRRPPSLCCRCHPSLCWRRPSLYRCHLLSLSALNR
jgi:hypothetical protein